jgi:hypothetical protein
MGGISKKPPAFTATSAANRRERDKDMVKPA